MPSPCWVTDHGDSFMSRIDMNLFEFSFRGYTIAITGVATKRIITVHVVDDSALSVHREKEVDSAAIDEKYSNTAALLRVVSVVM